jgi:uroporphyrinogen-III synthase
MPRALLTRPRAQSERLARELGDQGWEVDVWPVIDIRESELPPPPWHDAQAILFTSANAVRATVRFPRPDCPAFCVGAATARAARQAGYLRIENAAADVLGLIALTKDLATPHGGPLWYPHGRDTTGDLSGELTRAGYEVNTAIVYEAAETDAPPVAIAEAIKAGTYQAAAFFSPRSSALFVAQLSEEMKAGLSATKAVAISAAAAGPLANAGFGDIILASEPNARAMRRAIGQSA